MWLAREDLGKTANCQALVSLTLAQSEVPVPLALRLYLPEAWANDPARRARAKVPETIPFQTKGDIALAEVDRGRAAGVRFGLTLADAGYGKSAAFRAGLSARVACGGRSASRRPRRSIPLA